MNLIINISGNYGGGGFQVAISFLNECIGFRENHYYVFLGVNFKKQVDKSRFPDNFIFYDIPRLKFYQYHNYLNRLASKINPDVVFSIFGPAYWRPKVPHLVGYAIAHYLYKDSLYWKEISRWQRWKWFWKRKIHFYYFKHNSDNLVCETLEVKKRLENVFKNKNVYYVSNTCGTQFLKSDYKKIPPKLQKNGKFNF